MNILLISGHCASRVGAQGNGYHEYQLTIAGVKKIKAQLDTYDVNVHLYDEKRDAYVDATNGTLVLPVKYDYAFELHFNAHSNTSAHGTECFVTSQDKTIAVEQAVMKHMGKYFTLRDNDSVKDGVKRTDFLVIKTLGSKGIDGCLLEVCFITNKANMDVFKANESAIYQGIADAIATGFKLKPKATTPAPEAPDDYVGKTVQLHGYLYTTASGTGRKNTTVKSGVISKKHTAGTHPYMLGNGLGWLSVKDFTVVAAKPTKIEVGKPAKIKSGAYYVVNGGNKGKKIPSQYCNKDYNVIEIRTLQKNECARLESINSWVKVSDLTR